MDALLLAITFMLLVSNTALLIQIRSLSNRIKRLEDRS